MAVQIKYGDSYFRSTTSGGIRLTGSVRHLNYYLNNRAPTVIVLISTDFSKCHWVLFDAYKTSSTSNGWWIEVPWTNMLSASVKKTWREMLGPVVDYEQQMRINWALDKALLDAPSRFMVYIPKNDVVNVGFDYIEAVLARLSKNMDLTLRSRSTVNLFFPDYDDDPRETYEIPEVRAWFIASVQHGIPWFCFLDIGPKYSAVGLLACCVCEIESSEPRKAGNMLRFRPESFLQFIESNFENLNRFTESRGISEEINKELSNSITRQLTEGLSSDRK